MNEPENLMLDTLRKLQEGQSQIKAILADHGHQLIRLREELNSLRGDDIRREAIQAQMDMRLERIEIHLDLRDS
jgi:hypothetical protein